MSERTASFSLNLDDDKDNYLDEIMMNTKGLALAQPRALISPRERLVRATNKEVRTVFLLVASHLPLGVILYNVGIFAILHPIAVFLIGLKWAFKTQVKLERVLLAVGYLIGAEVLWRMAQVPVPWEFGKYGAAAIMIVALVRRRQYIIPQLPTLYFAALLPASVFLFLELSLSEARALLSSNLSGPFLLAVSCWFFANLKTSPPRLRHLMFAILIPLISVACTTLFYTVTIEDIRFTNESNLATSGGFGPNQVSAMLGLGVFISVCCLINFKTDGRLRLLLGAAAVLLAAQSVLTFSRTGIYSAIGACLALLFFRFRNPADGLKQLVPVLAISAVFIFLVFPALNTFTDGKLGQRFEDTSSTNRMTIAMIELQVFLEYPVFGTGVGLGDEYRRRLFGYGVSSHTEFSRLLSEHGSFGVMALALLIGMGVRNFRRHRSLFGRALVAGAAVWCVLFMMNSGMRLAAPAFLWGLIFVTIAPPRRSPRLAR